MEMKAKSAWQSSRTPAIAASMSPLKKKTSAKDERNSPKSTASSWDFDVDFEQNARNLKLMNTTFKSMSRKATGTFLAPITRTIGMVATRILTQIIAAAVDFQL